MATKEVEVYLNASPVPQAAINILEHQGEDPAVWEGKYYQFIEYTESFDTRDTDPPPSVPGTPWTRTTTITHTGDMFVNSADNVVVATVVDPDPPVPDDYAVSIEPNLDDSSVAPLTDAATRAQLLEQLASQSDTQEWIATADAVLQLGSLGTGWSGIWTGGTDTIIYGVASRISWAPYLIPYGWDGGAIAPPGHPHDLLRDGDLPLPMAVIKYTHEWDPSGTTSEIQKFTLPWDEYLVGGQTLGWFAAHDHLTPDGDGWETLPFDNTGNYAFGIDTINPYGNLNPLF